MNGPKVKPRPLNTLPHLPPLNTSPQPPPINTLPQPPPIPPMTQRQPIPATVHAVRHADNHDNKLVNEIVVRILRIIALVVGLGSLANCVILIKYAKQEYACIRNVTRVTERNIHYSQTQPITVITQRITTLPTTPAIPPAITDNFFDYKDILKMNQWEFCQEKQHRDACGVLCVARRSCTAFTILFFHNSKSGRCCFLKSQLSDPYTPEENSTFLGQRTTLYEKRDLTPTFKNALKNNICDGSSDKIAFTQPVDTIFTLHKCAGACLDSVICGWFQYRKVNGECSLYQTCNHRTSGGSDVYARDSESWVAPWDTR